jgi:beta-glucosidase
MKTRHGFALTALCLILGACSGGGGGGDSDPECTGDLQCPAGEFCEAELCVALPAGECRKEADCSGAETCVANVCEAPAGDCTAAVAALTARQPVIEVAASSGKTAKTFAKTFPNPTNATQECTAQLSFKDLNGDGALQPYEDWTLSPEERAVDLVGRMTTEQKVALLAHPQLTDDAAVTGASNGAGNAVSTALKAKINAGLRFGSSVQYTSPSRARAFWANNVQAAAESTTLGIPFLLSSAPTHQSAPALGRRHSAEFSDWPYEAGLAATGSLGHTESMGRFVSYEYRVIGLRMTLGPSANVGTEPRWAHVPFTFGESSAVVAQHVGKFVTAAQATWTNTGVIGNAALGAGGVATAVGDFPGAGPAKGGFDARLEKGRFLSYPGNHFDDHVAPFGAAVTAGAAAVVMSYGISETGPWTGLGGLVSGTTLEQVGASFSPALIQDVLRGHYGFEGVVLAPPGVLNDASVAAPVGAPWGMTTATKVQRAAKAVNAGVDQFLGLTDTTPISDAVADGAITVARLDAAAAKALELAIRLGLFENPYVNAASAANTLSGSPGRTAGLEAQADSVLVLVNNPKPAGFLDDGPTQGIAGNGTGKVLPAPPGVPYVAPGATMYVGGALDFDYVNGVVGGYSREFCNTRDVSPALQISGCEYVFIRVNAAGTADPDAGSLGYPTASLQYGASDGLDAVAAARAAIDAVPGSTAQLVVVIDGGRPSVLTEVLAYRPAAVVFGWYGQYPGNKDADKTILDVLFGVNAKAAGAGRLPFGLAASDAAAASQQPDTAGDGADVLFGAGAGLDIKAFDF